MKRIAKHKMTYHEADQLIERYYDALTTGGEEKHLREFLSQPGLPERYKAEQAILGYFGAPKVQKVFVLPPYLRWVSGIAAVMLLAVGLQFYAGSVAATNYAYIDGHKITNVADIKQKALASLSNVSGGDAVVQQNLENVSDAETIEQQLDVFSDK